MKSDTPFPTALAPVRSKIDVYGSAGVERSRIRVGKEEEEEGGLALGVSSKEFISSYSFIMHGK